eukprot:TCONS_00049728-protein
MFLSILLELKLFKVNIWQALAIEKVSCFIVYYNILLIIMLILMVIILLPIFHFAAKLDVYSYKISLVINCSMYLIALVLLLTLNYFCNLVCRKRAKQSKLTLNEKLEIVDEHIPDMTGLEQNKEESESKLIPLLIPLLKEVSEVFHKESTVLVPILTGSVAERFSVPLSSVDGKYWGMTRFNAHDRHAILSDHDFLIEYASVRASFNHGCDIRIETQSVNLNPGFVKLHDSSGSVISAKEVKTRIQEAVMKIDIRVIDGFDSFESRPYGAFPNTFIVGGYSSISQKGPAICLNYHILEKQFFYADLTFGIPCPGEWPFSSNWPVRTRKWPPSADVHRIVDMGFHFVPKSQVTDMEGVTWRYSFSLAEVELSRLISPVARKCFIALKIIGKDFLKQCCKNFKSYHMKTIFMYTLENTDPARWNDNHIETLFDMCLNDVINAVKIKNCPHFWIQDVNLFDNLTNEDFSKLENILMKIKNVQKIISRV